MPDSPTSSSAPVNSAFLAALEAGELDRADALLASLGKAVPPALLVPAAALHVRRQRWRAAARMLGRVIDPDAHAQLLRRFCANLAEFAEHRPEFDTLAAAGPDPLGWIASLAAPPERLNLPALLQQLEPTRATGEPIALVGVGDGSLAAALAADPPRLLLTQEQAVHLLIDDPAELRLALAFTDLTGPRGPIRARRFHWHLGPDPVDTLARAIDADPMIVLPTRLLSVRPDAPTLRVRDRLAALAAEIQHRSAALRRELEAHYRQLAPAHGSAVFGADPPRPPRALLITSRFTTVLQHSTRQVAAALQEMGWQTRLVIEARDWQRITELSVLRALEEHRPDLVFVIDHLRYEYGATFPSRLPMATWIQDQLPNLASARAGRSIGARDFVLTAVRPMYEGIWGYPPRQIIDTPTLGRFAPLPEQWESDGEDLSYVANAPPPTPKMLADLREAGQANPAIAPLLERCGAEMLATYARGECLPTLWHVGQLVDRVSGELGLGLADPQGRAALVNLLWHPLNNALFRWQALRWVVAVAQRRGLRFGLYGRGWPEHPEFAAWARGPVEPGDPLDALFRRTRINLQIVPSFCLHNRMLQGLAAGGFFLVRDHPTNALLPSLIGFVARHLDPSVQALEEARRSIAPPLRAALESQLQAAACLADLGQPIDLVNWARACERAGYLATEGMALPHLDRTVFKDEASLDRAVAAFLDAPDAAEIRRSIALDQRRSVQDRLSYPAGIRRVIGEIGKLLGEEGA